MKERSGKGSNLDAISLQAVEYGNTRQFQETSRNGAMEKSSGRGSNAWILHNMRNLSKFRNPQT